MNTTNTLAPENYIKEQITKTLIKELELRDIDKISIRDLCDHAGVGRASFYRHFTSKEDVIQQYATKLILKWGKNFEISPASKPSNVFESLFQHLWDYSAFYQLLYKANMTDIILKAIEEKIQMSPSLPNPDAYEKSFFAFGIYGWINEWVLRGMNESPEELNNLLQKSTTSLLLVMQNLYR